MTQMDQSDLFVDTGAQSSHPPGSDLRPYVRDMGSLVGRSSSISRTINRIHEGNEDMVRVASVPEIPTHHEKGNSTNQLSDLERCSDHFQLSPEQKQRKETMQVYLLEMGILFHSVFIGMSLSVSIGNEFVVLLIAIVFHRKFILLLSRCLVQVLDRIVHRNI